MNLSEEKIKELAEIQDPLSLDAPINDEEEVSIMDSIEQNKFSSPEESTHRELLRESVGRMLSRLSKEERAILTLRYQLYTTNSEIRTLEEVGDMLCLTGERIRQIGESAFLKLRKTLESGQEKINLRKKPAADVVFTAEDTLNDVIDILAEKSNRMTFKRLIKALTLVLSAPEFSWKVARHIEKVVKDRGFKRKFSKALWRAIQQSIKDGRNFADYFGVYFLVRLCKNTARIFLSNKNLNAPARFDNAVAEYGLWEKDNKDAPLFEKARVAYFLYLRHKLNMNHEAVYKWIMWTGFVSKILISEPATKKAAERLILILGLMGGYFKNLTYKGKIMFLNVKTKDLSRKYALKYANKEGERDKLEIAAFRPMQGGFSRYLTPGVTIKRFVEAGKQEDKVLNRAAYLFNIKLDGVDSCLFREILIAYRTWEEHNVGAALIVKAAKIWELCRSNWLRSQKSGLLSHWAAWMDLVGIILIKDINTKRAVRDIRAFIFENQKQFETMSYVERIRFLMKEIDNVAKKYNLEYGNGQGEKDKLEFAALCPMATTFP